MARTDGSAMPLVETLFDATRVIADAIEKKLKAATGLSLAQHEVLAKLARAPGRRLRMVDISDQVCVSKSAVTQIVDRLEESGLVGRESSPSDRRLTFAAITDRGLTLLAEAEPVFTPAAEEHVARHLSKEERRILQTALDKVLEGNSSPRSETSRPVDAVR